jgi:hypothetical protein
MLLAFTRPVLLLSLHLLPYGVANDETMRKSEASRVILHVSNGIENSLARRERAKRNIACAAIQSFIHYD